jgi:hypothetical protein
MKLSILLLAVLFLLAACQKEATIAPKINSITSVAVPKIIQDTIPDNAAFKIQLVADNINTDETMFLFKHNQGLNFDAMDDGLYFQGNGQVNLSSISLDGRDLGIYWLPYIPGMSIGLDVKTKSDGAYSLKLSYQTKIPANIQIWLKDTFLKDSIDVRTGPYNFNVLKSNTNTYGNQRFKLIIKEKIQQ